MAAGRKRKSYDPIRFMQLYNNPNLCASIKSLRSQQKTTCIGHAIPDVWREKTATKHAHNKPLALQKKLVLAKTSPGDVILDPSVGSYSVIHVVSDLGDRHFLGCDLIDPTNEKAG